uniref:PHD-type domain-containing protein n=1 Tax=Anopheles epiroticus TaxID=199890 RepID=A0A182NZD8_9DIPT
MAKVCYLCKSSEDDELLFGKFYTKYRLSVHYYCLLLSSNLVQKGVNDTVGIFGFLEHDIRRENERTKKCRCYICKEMHANVSCCAKKCLRTFHTVCGIRNQCLSHFTDTFQSWCATHVPIARDSHPHTAEEPCSICYDEMGPYERITSIRAPCCRNGWFHQRCLAQYAQSAGYFFKCPLCNNEDKFLPEIPRRGVFVPERDAAWELEPNAFQEQLIRPTACDAEDCKCEEGRSFDTHQWRLVICGSCGSTCRHRQCMEALPELSRAYVCQLCRPILGERIAMVEDSDDSSEDESVSSSASVSGRARLDKDGMSGAGSGESGVHCSSSDEMPATGRMRANRRVAILSDDSDNERSDASSVQIRRFVKQNTGKRVRRLLSDGSDGAASDPEEEEESETTNCKQPKTEVKAISTPHLSSVDRSAPVRGMDVEPCDDVSDNANVVCKRMTHLKMENHLGERTISESSEEVRTPKLLSGRRPRISSSTDDSLSDEQDDLPLSLSIKNRLNNTLKPSRTSCSEEKEEKGKDAKDPNSEVSYRQQKNDGSITKESIDTPTETSSALESPRAANTVVEQEASLETKENSNASDASCSTVGDSKRTKLRNRRPSSVGKPRSTSESSMEIARPKRAANGRRTRLGSTSSQSKEETAQSKGSDSDESDCWIPRSKRNRVSREHQRRRSKFRKRQKAPRSIISPPSTPPSLASETSQQSTSGSKEDLKDNSPTSSSCVSLPPASVTPNQQQQSIQKFFSLSSRKATTPSNSSRDVSMEEHCSGPFGRGGGSKISPIGGGKRANAGKRKRDSSDSPKRNRATHSPVVGGKQKGRAQGTTSSKAASEQNAERQRNVEKKLDKGQKNILNYFSRC